MGAINISDISVTNLARLPVAGGGGDVLHGVRKRDFGFKEFGEAYFSILEPAAIKAAQELATRLYGLDDNYEHQLAENKFLKQYKFVDNDLRFINKEGHLIDQDGRLVDKDGRFINDKGEYVDKEGNLVDDKGDYVTEFQPFLDDDGKPVVLEEKQEIEKNESSKRKSRKTKSGEPQTA